jgi:hypothetical protein
MLYQDSPNIFAVREAAAGRYTTGCSLNSYMSKEEKVLWNSGDVKEVSLRNE